MAFDSLLEIIKKAKEKYPSFSKKYKEAEAIGRWEAAVGKAIAKHSLPIRVEKSVLWVEVAHPIWRAELHYRKQQILDILNGVAPNSQQGFEKPQDALKDIQFVQPRK